jgi:membrane protease YdiL (CAAX protease family)
MDEPEVSPSFPSADSLAATPVSGDSRYIKLFVGRGGLRAGWRLLIFLALLVAIFSAATALSRLLHHRPSRLAGAIFTPKVVLIGEASSFALVLLASAIMARFERRKIAGYGLPWHRAFRREFWEGAAVGFAGISALLAAMRAAGVFHLESLALHGAAAVQYAVLWALTFLFVGLFEEFAFRGYALFTVATGIGFWPAALASSLLFGYVHHGNSGETWLGAFNAGFVGLLFCLILRRTGDLWMAIGFHAAWDWGESYFYGVPDSGQLAAGHLFNVSFSGPHWLSGGTVGPEGSWLCTFLLVVLWAIFLVWLRDAKYPNPAAISAQQSQLNTPGIIDRSIPT